MPPFRQTAAEWCFHKSENPAEYYRSLKNIGFYGVEMAQPDRWQAARDAGLELVNIAGPGMTWGLNQVAEHPKILGELRAAIATASKAAIPSIIVFSGNRRGLGDEQAIAACITGLSAIVDEAQSAKVTLLFEVLNAYDHGDYHADHSSFAFRVVREVASPALKVLYDVYHMQRMGEDLLEVISANLPLIGHFHIAGSPKRNYPGADQEIDYRTVIRRVQTLGYEGLWGHEFIPAAEPLDELRRVHQQFAAHAG